jgi:D-alanyl-D-alanine carboxypeptidase/D-alanyl-D-alanine-endopeptidase (penicillin-binding protein 4)
MLELLGSGLISIWLDLAGIKIQPVGTLEALAVQSSLGFVIAPDPSLVGAMTTRQYLQGLISSRLIPPDLASHQGIWLQSGPILMANHQGTVPLPAASLTKVATSLASFKTFGPNYQFQTLVGITGPIVNRVVNGDLVITGGTDPMFVGEEAIAIGNTLNKMGIQQVKGNLVITGKFAMNFSSNPNIAGQIFKQALNHKTWNRNLTYQHSIMPKGTLKPQLVINGVIKVAPPSRHNQLLPQTLLIRHLSLPLHQIIKEMNVYSNNEIAEMLSQHIGGAGVVRSISSQLAMVPQSEIQLINGSGLGRENRISPRAVTAMFMALQREAMASNLTLADLFPTSGLDNRGTMQHRNMPNATVMKTGTLSDVSALAGVLPTRDRGLVWFTIINRGNQVSSFRAEQDKLLQQLVKQLATDNIFLKTLTPNSGNKSVPSLGSPNRNEVIYKFSYPCQNRTLRKLC